MTFKKEKHKGKLKQNIKYFLSNLKKYVRKYKGKKNTGSVLEATKKN